MCGTRGTPANNPARLSQSRETSRPRSHQVSAASGERETKGRRMQPRRRYSRRDAGFDNAAPTVSSPSLSFTRYLGYVWHQHEPGALPNEREEWKMDHVFKRSFFFVKPNRLIVGFSFIEMKAFGFRFFWHSFIWWGLHKSACNEWLIWLDPYSTIPVCSALLTK